jgi:hypothetical protein
MCKRSHADDEPLVHRIGGKRDRPYALSPAGRATATGCHIIAHCGARVAEAPGGAHGAIKAYLLVII